MLVNGATGGVGSHFVQIAARRGARVVAVCRGENADYTRRLGAADVIDYTAGDVVEAVGFPTMGTFSRWATAMTTCETKIGRPLRVASTRSGKQLSGLS